MRACRLYDHKAGYASHPDFNPLDGAGGLHAHARWHERGQPVVYCAASPSLALLEILVHQDPQRFQEQMLLNLDIDVQDDAAELVTANQLVQLLRDAPAGDPESETRAYGTRWLREKRSLLLIVPSLVMPFENNLILNPLHPDVQRVRIVSSERFTLERRLLWHLGEKRPNTH